MEWGGGVLIKWKSRTVSATQDQRWALPCLGPGCTWSFHFLNLAGLLAHPSGKKSSFFISITAIKSYYSIKKYPIIEDAVDAAKLLRKLKRRSPSNVKSRQRSCQPRPSSQKSVVRKYANQLSGPTFRFHQTVKQLFTDEITARLAARQDRRFKNRPCDGEFICSIHCSFFRLWTECVRVRRSEAMVCSHLDDQKAK